MIWSVSQDLKMIEKIDSNSFVGMGIWERQHIEEWLKISPEILGEQLLIVSTEFNKFVQSNDRLDLLAIDKSGNLTVIEIKRTVAAEYADLQAIRYAAMISSMTIEKLIPYYVAYKEKQYGAKITNDEAREEITEFIEKDEFNELSNRPRIILCSENFSQEITATALWLRQFGIDISCTKITPYKHCDKIFIVPNKIIPLVEAQEYLIEIQNKEERVIEERRRQKTMKILLENGLLKAGQKVFLKNALPSYVKYDPNDPTFIATVTGKMGQSNAVVWEKDKNEYSITGLTWVIFKELHPEKRNPPGLNGTVNWVIDNGKCLWDLAKSII